ncbi:hypothetical protein ACN9MU_16560 [Pseudoduganella sp. R-32]|uniref:hypothetical protein n=1 Tax=Pseudoduganella sp. R-32 TaxID=3404061 RepID=UPI003CF97775
MSLAFAGPAASFANTVFSYFSPSKSPFYGVIAFGTAGLMLSCEEIDKALWWPISIPILGVLAVAYLLSLRDRPIFEESQHEDQLRFARSFSISSALLAMVLTARSVDKELTAFWGNYVACFTQILVFLLYAWARSATEESRTFINFVQFALITTTFLVGASFGLTEYVVHLPKPDQENKSSVVAFQYLYSAIGLYCLWGACIVRWLKHLVSLIHVEIPQPTKIN